MNARIPWQRKRWLRNTLLALLLGLPVLTVLAGWLLSSLLAVALKNPLALGDARLTLNHVDHGFLSTRLHYTLAWPLGNGKRVQLALEQRLDPGPWPWHSLKKGDYAPALLASTLHATHAALGPEGAPAMLPLQLALALRVGMGGGLAAELQADVPDLPLGALSVQAEQLQVRVQHHWWNQRVDTTLQAQRLGLRQGGEESAGLEGIAHHLAGTLEGPIRLQSKATVQQLALWGQALGPLNHALDVQGVDGNALAKAMGGDTSAWPQALPPGARLNGAVLQVQHAQAATEVHVRAHADTNTPLAVDIRLPQSAWVDAVQATPALAQWPGKAALAQQQAQMTFALVKGQLQASGWFMSDAQGLYSALGFGPTGAVVNGEAMSWEAFALRFFPPQP